MNIYEKLLNIQTELKAPKGQYNSFGKYKYRSCEDILEAVKPLLAKYKVALKLSDKISGGAENRYYVEATAILVDIENIDGEKAFVIENTAYAREEEAKRGMDSSQITGTASSYARKYALNGLFLIDDTKDADTDEFKKTTEQVEKITPQHLQALIMSINNNGITAETVESVLAKYKYKKMEDIEIVNYMKIVNDLKKSIGE